MEPLHELKGEFVHRTINDNCNTFQVGEPALTKLRYAAEFVVSNEQPVQDDILKELLQDVETMVTQILDADLPSYLKARLVECLEKVRLAILTYRLSGQPGLRKAFDEMAGTLLTNRLDLVAAVKSDDKTKKSVIGLFGLIDKINKIMELATKAKELLGPLRNWLLPGE